MKRYFLFAMGVALLGLTLLMQPVKSQVFSEFDTTRVVQATYSELQTRTVIPADYFGLPPAFPPDHDNGYSPVNLPFKFEYNGEVYSQIWININGFIMFTKQGEQPPFVAPDNPNALFIQANSYPTNVVAPFWGDHYYRTTADKFYGFKESEISWSDATDGVFVVQWKNLNINYKDINGNPIKSSVGNFQLRLYKSPDPYSYQGNIEFAYGQVGGNPDPVSGNNIITRGASVGLKGDVSDFVNGLIYMKTSDEPINTLLSRTSTILTNEWTPSGGTDWRILFPAKIVHRDLLFWGDGDVNFSKAEGSMHYAMPQNRYVTFADVRIILHSVSTNIPLDSVRGKAAYHADVNHNGRFYWTDAVPSQKVFIPWRNVNAADSLPQEINSIKRVFFYATEYDAAWILHYMAARIPELPWIHDTLVRYGKFGVDMKKADGITTGKAVTIGSNQYQIPVYLNGLNTGPLGLKFDISGEILDVQSSNISNEFNNSTVILAGTGDFDETLPICFITIKSDNSDLSFNNIRFNDNSIAGFSTKLTEVTDPMNNSVALQNSPNPFVTKTLISFNIGTQNTYSLAIYDLFGNLVKTLANENMSSGPHNIIWDGTNDNGNFVSNGVYVYRLVGGNLSVSNRLVLSK